MLVEILEFYLAVERVTCHPTVGRWGVVSVWGGWGGAVVLGKIARGILMVKTLSGAGLKDTSKFPLSQKTPGEWVVVGVGWGEST